MQFRTMVSALKVFIISHVHAYALLYSDFDQLKYW